MYLYLYIVQSGLLPSFGRRFPAAPSFGTQMSSGSMVFQTSNAGSAGISGALMFSSGTTSSGASGVLEIATGTAEGGKGDCTRMTVGKTSTT